MSGYTAKALEIVRSPTYRVMLQDVLDSPHDDIPRLILADYIDDEGWTDRAEFIRYQIAHPQATDGCHGDMEVGMPCGYGEDACPVCQDLHLFDGLPEVVLGEGAPGEPRYVIRRGFVDEIRGGLVGWLRHGKDIVNKAPVTKVEVFKRPFNKAAKMKRAGRTCLTEHSFYWVISKRPAGDDIVEQIPHFLPRELRGCGDGIRKEMADWPCNEIIGIYAYHSDLQDAMRALNERLLDVAKNGPYPRKK